MSVPYFHVKMDEIGSSDEMMRRSMILVLSDQMYWELKPLGIIMGPVCDGFR
ncbi:hypothetical protein HanIR_Chr12g0570071 [Helianthus annuus]|nr:hypothetical protein HanIR_Chr12g0570071 [Helianthus annuus]